MKVLPRLTLASRSPRRLELLSCAGIEPTVVPADVDESILPGESPHAYVARVARAKARAAIGPGRDYVLGADTAVVLEGSVLGKPGDRENATRMLRSLSGRTHEVLTGLALLAARAGRNDPVEEEMVVASSVTFVPLSDEQIAWYVASGEPLDKAGAYAIQGTAGVFVRSIAGSVSNVVGLPLVETLEMLGRMGFPLPWVTR
jgi:septum formation protein